jgi:hypothetical protein
MSWLILVDFEDIEMMAGSMLLLSLMTTEVGAGELVVLPLLLPLLLRPLAVAC